MQYKKSRTPQCAEDRAQSPVQRKRRTYKQMFSTLGSDLIRQGVIALSTGLFVASAYAAPIGLEAPFPDPNVDSQGLAIHYDYTGAAVNTLTITGQLAPGENWGDFDGTFDNSESVLAGASYRNASSQFLHHVNGDTSIISANPSGPAVTQTPYLLVANFDVNGNFIDGQVRIGGYSMESCNIFGCTPDSYFATHSGTILTMDLFEFGFQGTGTASGDRDTVVFEWMGDINGGDLYDVGFAGQTGGAVAVGNVLWGTLDPTATGAGMTYAGAGGKWDPLLNNDMTAFKTDFVSCSSCPVKMDTFVPVPAAIWLFGTGLIGLVGVGARKRKNRQIA